MTSLFDVRLKTCGWNGAAVVPDVHGWVDTPARSNRTLDQRHRRVPNGSVLVPILFQSSCYNIPLGSPASIAHLLRLNPATIWPAEVTPVVVRETWGST